jgi:hypothetical protein
MPINTIHEDVKEYLPIWKMVEDFFEGEIAVKNAGTKYLPKLSGQTNAKYEAFKKRAVFYSAISRTCYALVGAVYRKPPAILLPEKLEYLRKDATGTGMSLVELAITLSIELMKTGRAGLLVDRPEEGGMPYLTLFDADDILNWDQTPGNEFIVLENEVSVPDPKDKFSSKSVEGYRELTFDADGNYIVNIWMPKDKSKDFVVVSTIQPTKNGKPIQYIPFCVVSPTGLDFEIDKPPVLDMVHVLEKHYQLSADHANALHTICTPTPYIIGLTPPDNFQLNLGADSAIILPDVGSKVGFLEFTGQGIKSVEDGLVKLEGMLGALGARMVEATGAKTLIETAEGARTREAVATAVLGSIIASVEAALENCLGWAADWEGLDTTQVKVKLNRELVSSTLDANMVSALLNAVNAGKLSFESFYSALEEAGMTDSGVDAAAEKERIKDNPEAPVKVVMQPTTQIEDDKDNQNT